MRKLLISQVSYFKVNTSEGTSSMFQILQDLRLKQYQEKCYSDTMQNDSKMFHMTSTTNTVQATAQPATSFRTITPSTAMSGTKTTTKQVNPIQVHPDTSHKAPLGHCTSRILYACPPTHSSGLQTR